MIGGNDPVTFRLEIAEAVTGVFHHRLEVLGLIDSER
jgi:hypothetical protein